MEGVQVNMFDLPQPSDENDIGNNLDEDIHLVFDGENAGRESSMSRHNEGIREGGLDEDEPRHPVESNSTGTILRGHLDVSSHDAADHFHNTFPQLFPPEPSPNNPDLFVPSRDGGGEFPPTSSFAPTSLTYPHGNMAQDQSGMRRVNTFAAGNIQRLVAYPSDGLEMSIPPLFTPDEPPRFSSMSASSTIQHGNRSRSPRENSEAVGRSAKNARVEESEDAGNEEAPRAIASSGGTFEHLSFNPYSAEVSVIATTAKTHSPRASDLVRHGDISSDPFELNMRRSQMEHLPSRGNSHADFVTMPNMSYVLAEHRGLTQSPSSKRIVANPTDSSFKLLSDGYDIVPPPPDRLSRRSSGDLGAPVQKRRGSRASVSPRDSPRKTPVGSPRRTPQTSPRSAPLGLSVGLASSRALGDSLNMAPDQQKPRVFPGMTRSEESYENDIMPDQISLGASLSSNVLPRGESTLDSQQTTPSIAPEQMLETSSESKQVKLSSIPPPPTSPDDSSSQLMTEIRNPETADASSDDEGDEDEDGNDVDDEAEGRDRGKGSGPDTMAHGGKPRAARGRPFKEDESLDDPACRWSGCTSCFSGPSEARKHEKTHGNQQQEDGSFTCLIGACGRAFKTSRQLRKHIALHLPRAHKCDACGKTFHDAAKLIRHQKSHTDEKPFICELCGKSFSLRANLKTHERVHSGERPFVCPLMGCNKSFAQACNRNTHVQTHHKRQVVDVSAVGDATHIRAVGPPNANGVLTYVPVPGVTTMHPFGSTNTAAPSMSLYGWPGTNVPFTLPGQQGGSQSWRTSSGSGSQQHHLARPQQLDPSAWPFNQLADAATAMHGSTSHAPAAGGPRPRPGPGSSLGNTNPEAKVEDASLLLLFQTKPQL